MNVWLNTTWDRLRSSYWFIPTVMALASVALSVACIQLDSHYRDDTLREQGWVYTGGPEGARAVLSTIAGSIITVAGTTFSITIAALSLASAQFGPRLLRNFMRDTGNQVVLGTYTATFLYCLLILRTVRGLEDNQYVPHISVTVGVVLAVVSVAVLIYFVHHVAESIQVSHLIEVVSHELAAAIERIFPQRLGGPADDREHEFDSGSPILSASEGYIQAIDEKGLMGVATQHNLRIKVQMRPGDYMVRGQAMALVLPVDAATAAADGVRASFALGRDRTTHQDAVFAFLQLAEISVRALSPGVNDPFTAIMCLDRITSGMCLLAERELPGAVRLDDSGAVRIVARPYAYDELVEAGYRHIREAATGHWDVCRRLREQIEFVSNRTREGEFRAALRRELNALEQSPSA